MSSCTETGETLIGEASRFAPELQQFRQALVPQTFDFSRCESRRPDDFGQQGQRARETIGQNRRPHVTGVPRGIGGQCTTQSLEFLGEGAGAEPFSSFGKAGRRQRSDASMRSLFRRAPTSYEADCRERAAEPAR
jgi:hypothetical protein